VNHKIAKLGALAALTCFCSVAGPARTSTAANRPVDHATGCPQDEEYSGIFAVLLDTTDPISPVQQEIVRKKLDEFGKNLPRYGKLEVFAVRSTSDRLIEPLLQVCNPGRANDTNVLTGNPTLMEKKWHEEFMNPLDKSLKVALSDFVSAKQSPIMEEIQEVSVDAFFETPPKTSKRLVIVSDMLQNSAVLNQYRQIEPFQEFEHQPGYVKVRPELDDVEVTILYVRRSSEFNRQGKRHVEFWQAFFAASGARIEEVMSISGYLHGK
jgi:hypothetical protein